MYIVTAKRGDIHRDTTYSKEEYSRGIKIDGDNKISRMVSTRERNRTIKITINERGESMVSLIDTPDNINENQARLLRRRKKRVLKSWGYS